MPRGTMRVLEKYWASHEKALVSHTFVFVYMHELFRTCLKEMKEITVKLVKIIEHSLRNTAYSKAIETGGDWLG